MRLIAALFLLAVSLSADATNYYRWGWEDTRPSWGINGRATNAGCYLNPGTGCTNGTPAGSSSARDCTVSHTGSCSMKMVVIGDDGGNQGLGYDQIAALPNYTFNVIGSTVYYRFWMRLNTGFSFGVDAAGGKVKTSRVDGSPGYARMYTGYIKRDRITIGECGTSSPTCKTATGADAGDSDIYVAYDFTAVADSTWREYVVKVKANTDAACTPGTNCDAELCLWVNNVLVGSCYTGWRLFSVAGAIVLHEQWGAWMVYPYWQLRGTASDGGTVYIDDVSVDSVYNSSIALPKPTNPVVSQLDQFMRYDVASYRHLGAYQGAL